MYAGDAVLTLRLDEQHWRIEAQTVNFEQCPHSSRWMLATVRDNLERVLQVFPKKVPYSVLLSTDDGQFVELADLKQAGVFVRLADATATNSTSSSIAPRVKAKPLKSMWLPDSTDCEFCCCYQSPADVCGHILGLCGG